MQPSFTKSEFVLVGATLELRVRHEVLQVSLWTMRTDKDQINGGARSGR